MKFKDAKIGRRVIAKTNIDGNGTKNIEGVIIDTDDGDFWNILVEFDDDVVGAWNNQCWCNGRHLDLVPEEAIDEVKLSFSELMSV